MKIKNFNTMYKDILAPLKAGWHNFLTKVYPYTFSCKSKSFCVFILIFIINYAPGSQESIGVT